MDENQVVFKSEHLEIRFESKTKTNLTSIYAVVNGAVRLGSISWYAPWRQYTFSPSGGMVFDVSCLLDIVSFIGGLMNEYREKKLAQEQQHAAVL